MPNVNDYFKKGDWNVLCDICGFKYKASQLRKNWKNEWVCDKDFELRNAQDYIRVRPEKIAVPWARPDNDGIPIFTCFLWTSSAYADLGAADCMRADSAPMSYAQLYQLAYPQNTNVGTSFIPGWAIPSLATTGVITSGINNGSN